VVPGIQAWYFLFACRFICLLLFGEALPCLDSASFTPVPLARVSFLKRVVLGYLKTFFVFTVLNAYD